jgi:tRNA threonylcarbamoyladenosine biosynthesis protein TsaB
MRILAIESALLGGSIAASLGSQPLAEASLDGQRRTAQTLAPAIRDLLKRVGWRPGDVQLVGVTQGPGSFTGLRIGVTTAKVLAYAAQAEILGVNTLAALAEQVPLARRPLWAVLDAERSQLFAARYSADHDGWVEDVPTHVVYASSWLAQLAPESIVTGPPLSELRRELPPSVIVAPDSAWIPRASAVGRLAWRLYCGGQRADHWSLLPHYFRESAAEEKSRTAPGREGQQP